jgi:hypothetical protein
MATTPLVRSDQAELVFASDQALTEALVNVQQRVISKGFSNDLGKVLHLLNDEQFAVIIRPAYPGSAYTVTLRHVGGAELDSCGPNVSQLLLGFLGIEASAGGQPLDFEAA